MLPRLRDGDHCSEGLGDGETDAAGADGDEHASGMVGCSRVRVRCCGAGP